MFVENMCKLNEQQLKFIELVESSNFPWFYQKSTSDKYKAYSHTLMNRDVNSMPIPGMINSHHFDICKSIFDDFCAENNIVYSHVLRGAINASSHFSDAHGDIHTDHNFPHKNFIVYLNEFDRGGTYFYEDNGINLIKVSQPKKFKGIVWDGGKHAAGWCAVNQIKIVLIMTFI